MYSPVKIIKRSQVRVIWASQHMHQGKKIEPQTTRLLRNEIFCESLEEKTKEKLFSQTPTFKFHLEIEIASLFYIQSQI